MYANMSICPITTKLSTQVNYTMTKLSANHNTLQKLVVHVCGYNLGPITTKLCTQVYNLPLIVTYMGRSKAPHVHLRRL